MTGKNEDFDHRVFVKTLPGSPGVYQRYDAADKLLYVGKAKNLKNLVSSYFRSRGLTDRMVSLVNSMLDFHKQLTATRTADEKNAIQRIIDATDKEIDRLVYELYELTEEEIGIVEGEI